MNVIRPRRTALAAALAALALAGCGTEHASRGGGANAAALGFTRHTDAVQFPSAYDYVAPGEGLQTLVPVGDCALGVGTYANGFRYVGANWTGGADCTKLTIDPAPGTGGDDHPDGIPTKDGGWNGGGLAGSADTVLPWTDGSLLAVSGGVAHRAADGKIRYGADLHLVTNTRPQQETADDSRVTAAARAGSRLLIGGWQYLSQVQSPFLMVSDDGGTTVRRQSLPPVPGGGQPSTGIGSFGVNGGEVVAFGQAATNAYTYAQDGTLPFWHSADGGRHWTAALLSGMPPGAGVAEVVRSGGRWFAVGGYATGKLHTGMPFILTSTNGTAWTRVDTKAMGKGAIVAATLDGAGRPVLVGSQRLPASAPGKRQEACGSVWLGDGTATGWRRGELGCDQNPPTAVTTLRDGRVLIAGNRTLWIGRPAAPGRKAHAKR